MVAAVPEIGRRPDAVTMAAELRLVADRVEQGTVKTVVMAYEVDDGYRYGWTGGWSLVLGIATLLHRRIIDRQLDQF